MSLKSSLPSSTGALILLITCFGCLVVGEIGSDFSHCLRFFYKETPPTGIEGDVYQPICQRYSNQYRFASLYHRQHRAPLFSAYILSPAVGGRPDDPWMYEPQLASPGASPEMEPFPATVENVVESQAVLQDYESSNFTKGHLNPRLHQQTTEDQEATFTLTNIVPQREGSNSGTWSLFEESVLKKFQNFCNGSMYVITGVMPYTTEGHFIKNRVSVPEYLWSAYCCLSYKHDKSQREFFPTYAAVGRNDPSSGEEIVPVNTKLKPPLQGYDVKKMPLKDLEVILAQRLNMPISLFDGNCQK